MSTAGWLAHLAGPGQRAYHLDRLHALLAESLGVQSARRTLEVG